ncbi:hypothetical protein [Microvirga sp. 2TAF3]|uniref:hypothetical protein n=1 Tax=Microvirga sp. 2TAF3 TaxID=3233014 RepID=UPI003F9453B9
MNKTLFAVIGLMLLPLPALSQGMSRSEDQDSSYSRKDRDEDGSLRDLLRDMYGDGGASRGALFRLRSGDAAVTVRCDSRDSMRACVEATLTLLDRASRAMPQAGGQGGAPPPPGGTPPSR